ncbi:MAG: Hpt domain-containing protein, partial [Sinobacteraceae bacterium]|nr:Hpt domain-containing protein [Nevskiaceae bacterium]
MSIKRLLGLADREMRRLYEQGEARYAQTPAVELLNNLLYYVGRAESSGPRVTAVRASFRLSELLPVDESIEQERENLSAPSVKLMQTVAAAIREDLSKVKDVLDIFVRRGAGQPKELASQVEMLRKIGDTLGVLGLGELRAQVQTQTERLENIVSGSHQADESSLVEIAATLIGVEDRLDSQLVGLIRPKSTTVSEEDIDNEFQQVQSAVLRECILNLARIKEAITQSVGGTLDAAGLDSWPELMRGLKAGLLMLGKARAVEVIEGITNQLKRVMQPGAHSLPPGFLDRLADAIVSVEYYMETLQAGRSDPWYMLDNAQACVQALESQLETPLPVIPPIEAGVYSKTVQISPPGALAEADPAATLVGVPPPAVSATRPITAPLAESADPELVKLFIEEAQEELAKIRKFFPAWDQNPMERDSLVTVRRSFHTLKGSGRMVGARDLGEFAWSVENLLNRILDNTLSRSPQIVEVLRDAVAALPELIEQLDTGRAVRANTAGICSRAQALASGKPAAAAAAAPAGPATPATPVTPVTPATPVAPATSVATAAPAAPAAVAAPTATQTGAMPAPQISATAAATAAAPAGSAATTAPATSAPATAQPSAPATVQPGAPAAGTSASERPSQPETAATESLSTGQPEQSEPSFVLDGLAHDEVATHPALHVEGITPAANEPRLSQRAAQDGGAKGQQDVEERADQAHRAEADGAERHRAETPGSEAGQLAPAAAASAAGTAGIVEQPWAPEQPHVVEPPESGSRPVLDFTTDEVVVRGDGENGQSGKDEVLRDIYTRETSTHVATVRSYLERERTRPEPHTIPEDVYRACHTLSGSSKMAQVRHGIRLAEPLDHWLRRVFNSGLGLGDTDLQLLTDCMDAMESVVAHLDETSGYFHHHAALKQQIDEAEKRLDARIADARAQAVQAAPAQGEGADDGALDYDPEVASIFTEEALELIEFSEQALGEWRDDPESAERRSALKRPLHTLKGGARMAGIISMGNLSHELETLVMQVDNGAVAADAEMFDVIQASLDELARMREAVANGRRVAPARAMIARIQSVSKAGGTGARPLVVPPQDEPVASQEPDVASAQAASAQAASAQPASAQPASAQPANAQSASAPAPSTEAAAQAMQGEIGESDETLIAHAPFATEESVASDLASGSVAAELAASQTDSSEPALHS